MRSDNTQAIDISYLCGYLPHNCRIFSAAGDFMIASRKPRARLIENIQMRLEAEIVQTGNIYLFPHLKIPRTTAQSWIRSRRSRGRQQTDHSTLYDGKIRHLESEIQKERLLRELLLMAQRLLPFHFRHRILKNKKHCREIVLAIQRCFAFHTLSQCLDLIGLPRRTYYRWSAESSMCQLKTKKCTSSHPSQLTQREVEVMNKFVTSKKVCPYLDSISSSLSAKEGLLYCSIGTWRKYIDLRGWRRPGDRKSARSENRDFAPRIQIKSGIWM